MLFVRVNVCSESFKVISGHVLYAWINLAESHKGVDNMKKIIVASTDTSKMSKDRKAGYEAGKKILEKYRQLMEGLKNK